MAQARGAVAAGGAGERRRALIDATMTAVAEDGLSSLTLARIAARAGMTAGSVNFHFNSKEALLLETLQHVAEEFETAIAAALAEAGEDPARQLEAVVDASVDPVLTEPRKLAVWYAFMAEGHARLEYQRICGERDAGWSRTLHRLCEAVIATGPAPRSMDGEALSAALAGLIDGIWQEVLFTPEHGDREAARRQCRRFLASVFPWAYELPVAAPGADEAPDAGDGPPRTLPAWVYEDPEFFELEKTRLFMDAWQIACHVNDLPEPGRYVRFEVLDERALIVRDRAGVIRAFHNVCPHRAHSLVQDEAGRCPGRLTCPYHGWTFALDGRRVGLAAPEAFRPHDAERFALKPLDCEVYEGFVFVRSRSGGPSVAELFAPVAEELAAYRIPEMRPCGGWSPEAGFWTETLAVDWKNAVENYLEDYHFPTGHKGLAALMEDDYDRDALGGGLARLSHRMRDKPLQGWSVRHYHALLPGFAHLPGDQRRRWSYYALFPAVFLDCFPEQIDFFQMLPAGPGKVTLRGGTYALPDGGDRRARAARWLSDRINRQVQREDNALTGEVQKGLRSSGYGAGVLCDKEVLVRYFQDWIRERLPVAGLHERPAPGTLARRNADLAADA